jgi:hypothetical protein
VIRKILNFQNWNGDLNFSGVGMDECELLCAAVGDSTTGQVGFGMSKCFVQQDRQTNIEMERYKQRNG